MKLNNKIVKRATQLLNQSGYQILDTKFYNEFKVRQDFTEGYARIELNDNQDKIKITFQMLENNIIIANFN